jgi:hypothetical protein
MVKLRVFRWLVEEMILSWMNIRRHFVSIMLMFCGLASSKGNRSFVRNYKDHDQRDAPIDALICGNVAFLENKL